MGCLQLELPFLLRNVVKKIKILLLHVLRSQPFKRLAAALLTSRYGYVFSRALINGLVTIGRIFPMKQSKPGLGSFQALSYT